MDRRANRPPGVRSDCDKLLPFPSSVSTTPLFPPGGRRGVSGCHDALKAYYHARTCDPTGAKLCWFSELKQGGHCFKESNLLVSLQKRGPKYSTSDKYRQLVNRPQPTNSVSLPVGSTLNRCSGSKNEGHIKKCLLLSCSCLFQCKSYRYLSLLLLVCFSVSLIIENPLSRPFWMKGPVEVSVYFTSFCDTQPSFRSLCLGWGFNWRNGTEQNWLKLPHE